MMFFLLVCAVQARGVSFTEEAAARGANVDGFGRGAAMADFDGDGLLDLFVADGSGQDRLLRGLPGGTFSDVTAAWGVSVGGRHTMGALAADFDEDGDLDLYLPCGADAGAEYNVLLRNDLALLGRFTDVSAASGAAGNLAASTFGACAADFDRDGDLDLFLSNHRSSAASHPHCNLLRNDGSLRFTDVSAAAGIVHGGSFMHCGAGDFDGDGWMDVGVADFSGPPRLYRNRGNGTFQEVAAQTGLTVAGKCYGMLWEDFDGDGDLDLFMPRYMQSSALYLNDGSGRFSDAAAAAGIPLARIMGHTAADFDGDGTADLFFGTGLPAQAFPDLLVLLAPLGPGGSLRARDWSAASGIAAYGDTRCHGSPVGDLNSDGYPDLYLNHGGPDSLPSTSQRNALWMNQGNTNRWITARLRGTRGNRMGVGVLAAAVLPGGVRVHKQLAVGRGFCNTDEPVLRFGLGAAAAADWLELRWPSGLRQTVLPAPAGALIEVVETGCEQRTPAAVGASFEVKCWGAPSRDARLLASRALAWTPRPDLGGVLELADSASEVASLTLDAAGAGLALVSVANDPRLAGTTLFLQLMTEDPAQPAMAGALGGAIAVTIH